LRIGTLPEVEKQIPGYAQNTVFFYYRQNRTFFLPGNYSLTETPESQPQYFSEFSFTNRAEFLMGLPKVIPSLGGVPLCQTGVAPHPHPKMKGTLTPDLPF
jgi:hypothetical protein